MNKEFIPYEQALELKELGFDEPCFGTFYKKELSHYPNSREEETGFNITPFELVKNTEVVGLIADTITAPLYQQAFRWFREKYGYLHHITYFDPVKAQIPGEADYQGAVLFPHQGVHKLAKISYDTYEEAEQACLKKLIEIVKDGTKINTRED